MSKIEVDPKLFVTCRLCLEDMGQYQIVPAIQQQIKYCFDIDVEPFDGLPQLICKKCELILSEYFVTKSTFNNKQNELKNKIGDKKVKYELPQQETVSSSQHNEYDTVNSDKLIIARKRRVLISSTSSDTDTADENIQKYVNTKIASSELSELGYNKLFACRLCKRQFKRRCDLKNHSYVHKHLREKYSYILNNNCMVKLEKLDNKPNMTGRNTVVLSNTKIIEEGDSDHYVMYVPKQLNDNFVHNKYDTSDDSDEEFIVKKKRTKRRLVSKSSNDTVVIETNDIRSISVNEKPKIKYSERKDKGECIKIDDSSDSSSDKNDLSNDSQSIAKKSVTAKLDDFKTIQNIIVMCRNKYKKRVDNEPQIKKIGGKNYSANAETQLKRKVLSIGRKVVNNHGLFNCTGLLRFMEHKNLEIIWIPRTFLNPTNGKNYVRILMKKKSDVGESDSNEVGWTNVGDSVALKQNDETAPTPFPTQSNENVPISDNDSAVLYDLNVSGADSKNKLLNENPVANPKQLPKKFISDPKTNSVKTISAMQNTPAINSSAENLVANIDNLCMPIITSTTSLAPLQITDKQSEEVNVEHEKCDTQKLSNNANNTNIPRIKVKPVSELMSESSLYNLLKENAPSDPNILNQNQQINAYAHQHSVNYIPGVVVPSSAVPLIRNPVQGASSIGSTERATIQAPVAITNSEYVILDTVELPNTKTDSPFKYLKNLLQIHNITLLDTNETLTQDSTCLIKFKVVFKQENKDQPVVLCLALFCHRNAFCIKVKDRNQENLDITKISANWQWEIIKIFKGDVVNKLLQNAQKISQERYEYTKSFLCLLKSINCMKDS